jgi:hypothetical protein
MYDTGTPEEYSGRKQREERQMSERRARRDREGPRPCAKNPDAREKESADSRA